MYHKLTRALGAFFVLSALAWTAAAPPAAEALSNCSVDDASVDGEEQAFLGLINAYRAKSGAPPLSIDPALTRAATWMANDLARNSRFGHADSLGRSPWVRMPDCGVAAPGGENLAAGTNYSSASTALQAWINSPSHNSLMQEAEFGTIGIARAHSPSSHYGWYWVTDFGYGGKPAPAPAAAAPPPPAPAAPPPAAAARPAAPAPVPAAPAPEPEPRLLGIPEGLSLVTWDGGYVSPDEVFGGRESIAMVYVFDLETQTWLRWGSALDPILRSLTEMRTGVDYWVVATGEASVPMP